MIILEFDKLAEAYGLIEGKYDSVGKFCIADGGKNRGRGLGRYQYMSYRNDVIKIISSKDKGLQYLKVCGCPEITADEQHYLKAMMFHFFSESQQDKLFKTDQLHLINLASKQIDPTTNKVFTGDRLIERVGQMHYQGPKCTIDGETTDSLGKITIKQYGKKLVENYKKCQK